MSRAPALRSLLCVVNARFVAQVFDCRTCGVGKPQPNYLDDISVCVFVSPSAHCNHTREARLCSHNAVCGAVRVSYPVCGLGGGVGRRGCPT